MIRSGAASKSPWNNIKNITENVSSSVITYNSSEVSSSKIYSTLKVEEGKPKIILETFLNWDSGCNDVNGNNVSTAREAFGLHFANPKNHSYAYFNSVVIFTPNAGFPETRPN